MAVKVMKLRYAGVCSCGQELPAGTRAGWDQDAKRVLCPVCLGNEPVAAEERVPSAKLVEDAAGDAIPELVDGVGPAAAASTPGIGVAGASLQREHDRRAAKREDRIRARFPRAGGLILAVTNEPQTTRAFKSGAEGERLAAAKIVEGCSPHVLFLLNRQLGPGRRDGDIDMIAISAAGVHVIDVKRYKGAKVEVRRSGGFLSKATEGLFVGGRDRTTMLEGLAKQVAAVRVALVGPADTESVAISAALCFVDAELPLFGTLRIGDVHIRTPKGTTSELKDARGPLDEQGRTKLHGLLAKALPPAP